LREWKASKTIQHIFLYFLVIPLNYCTHTHKKQKYNFSFLFLHLPHPFMHTTKQCTQWWVDYLLLQSLRISSSILLLLLLCISSNFMYLCVCVCVLARKIWKSLSSVIGRLKMKLWGRRDALKLVWIDFYSHC